MLRSYCNSYFPCQYYFVYIVSYRRPKRCRAGAAPQWVVGQQWRLKDAHARAYAFTNLNVLSSPFYYVRQADLELASPLSRSAGVVLSESR